MLFNCGLYLEPQPRDKSNVPGISPWEKSIGSPIIHSPGSERSCDTLIINVLKNQARRGLCFGGSGHSAQRERTRRCRLGKGSQRRGRSLKVNDLAGPVGLFFVAHGAPNVKHGRPVTGRAALLRESRLEISNDGWNRNRSLTMQAYDTSERLAFRLKSHFKPR